MDEALGAQVVHAVADLGGLNEEGFFFKSVVAIGFNLSVILPKVVSPRWSEQMRDDHGERRGGSQEEPTPESS